MVIKGKYNKAWVYTSVIEGEAVTQIQAMCDSEIFKGQKIRIMPDVHAGSGCTIGTTMTVADKIVPQMVGVDIGCGMEVVELAEKEIDFEKLDKFIHEHIPSGMAHRETRHPYTEKIQLEELFCASRVKLDAGYLSLGSLGGGNHFIEVDKDEDGTLYLVVHSGSRHLGLEVAEYYQKAAQKNRANGGMSERELIESLKAQGREQEIEQALKQAKKAYEEMSDLVGADAFAAQCLEGQLFDAYIHDMRIMQEFASLNRRAMTDLILEGLGLTEVSRFTTVHNYIDMEYMILRKGAVSAQKGERLLIPINMRDGSLICIGKGNAAWNCSAPHGAGRLMSRNKARKTLSMEEFRAQMQGIYSTSVTASTIDESPMAYKKLEDIVENIKPTVKIEKRILPVYNFKATEDPTEKRKKRK